MRAAERFRPGRIGCSCWNYSDWRQGRDAFEFRHPSWFVEEVYELLREHDVTLIVGDHPRRDFQCYETTTGWRFVRFHYGARERRDKGKDEADVRS